MSDFREETPGSGAMFEASAGVDAHPGPLVYVDHPYPGFIQCVDHESAGQNTGANELLILTRGLVFQQARTRVEAPRDPLSLVERHFFES